MTKAKPKTPEPKEEAPEKKYEFTDVKIVHKKHYSISDIFTPEREITVHQIRALVDIPEHGVKKGHLGGYIEDESNLSQTGASWVGKYAVVCDAGKVQDDAFIGGKVVVANHARVTGKSRVTGNKYTLVSGNVQISGNAVVNICGGIVGGDKEWTPANESDFHHNDRGVSIGANAVLDLRKSVSYHTTIHGRNIHIGGDAMFCEPDIPDVKYLDGISVYSNTTIYGRAKIFGGHFEGTTISDDVKVYAGEFKGKDIRISGNAVIFGSNTRFKVTGSVKIRGNTVIGSERTVRDILDTTLEGDVDIYDAKIGQNVHLTYGNFTGDSYDHSTEVQRRYIACALNLLPIKGEYIVYKPVRRVEPGVYLSYDGGGNHLFRNGKQTTSYRKIMRHGERYTNDIYNVAHITIPDGYKWEDILSRPDLTIIALKVKEKDVATINHTEMWCSKVTTIGEVTSPLNPGEELPKKKGDLYIHSDFDD